MNKRYINSNNFQDSLIAIAFPISTFVYPITAVFILFLSLPTTSTNFLLKFIYAFFYLYIIIISYLKGQLKLNKFSIPLLIFFFVYSFRLFYDLSIRNIQFSSGSQSYVYSYYFGATFLPSFLIMTSFRNLNPDKIFKYVYLTLLLSNIFLICYIFVNGAQSIIEMLSGRIGLNSEDDFGTSGVFINPIQISLAGASLSIITLVNLLFPRNKNFYIIYVQSIILFLGIFNLFVGASRGPLISFILVSFFILFYKFYKMKKNFYFLRNLIFTVIIFFTLFVIISTFRKYNDIFLIDRIEVFYDNIITNTKEDRNYIFEEALDLFKESPIIGSQFVINNGGYPHNLFYEVLMSLGLFGLTLFIWVIYNLLKKIVLLFKAKTVPSETIGLFSLCFLVIFLGLTSGSIFVNPEIWVCASLILSLTINDNKNLIT